MNCPKCSGKTIKNGRARNNKGGQRYKCINSECKYEFTTTDILHKSKINILILDIETAPLEALIWSMWNNDIHSQEQLLSDWYCLTWACKWLYEPEVYSSKLSVGEAKSKDDKRIMEELWGFVNAADIIIAHNAKKFDVPKMNTRFLIHGFDPPTPYQIIDTLTVAKKFKHSSNRLDFINNSLGIGRKLETKFKLWRDCRDGSREALRDMETYNIRDVDILEEHYLRVRPWIKNHPNLGVYIDSDVSRCPNCGSENIKWKDNFYHTTTNKYSIFRCNDCGALGHARESAMTKTSRKNLVVPIAR